MKKLLFTLVLLLFANSAFAWGDFERGMTAGVAGFWLYNRLTQPAPQVLIINPSQTVGTRQIYQTPPTVYYNTVPYCRNIPVTDHYGRVIAYQQHCD